MNNNQKKYKVVIPVNELEKNEGTGKLIARFGLLAIVCIMAFLIAKYIVRNDISGEESPIDTSERI